MEKKATDHARQLVEKYVGRPFFDLPYGKGTQRLSYEELNEALDWVDDRFHLIRWASSPHTYLFGGGGGGGLGG